MVTQRKNRNDIIRISIIGSGNVATRLAIAFSKAGFAIEQIIGRNKRNASLLAQQVNASAETDLQKFKDVVDFVFICSKDDEIQTIASRLKCRKAILVHCSGSISMEPLKLNALHCGVIYPLQTLQKDKAIAFSEVPLLIEASDKSTEKKIQQVAKAISRRVTYLSSEKRKKLHLAAVFVSNFSNHLYHLSQDYLNQENIPFDLLIPLIDETTAKLKTESAAKNQTGPARRNDKKTQKAHLELLKEEKMMRSIYRLLSKSINLKFDKK